MIKALSNEQMRAADAHTINDLCVSSETLMLRAGEAIAEEVARAAKARALERIEIVCGTGNNGGDGFVAARRLKELGFDVSVYLLSGNLSGDCERERMRYDGEYSSEIEAEVVVDCIFGTGLNREVSGEAKDVVDKINSSGAFVVSADIPSGLSGDSGQNLGSCVNADLTVAVAERKRGHYLSAGPDVCGKIVTADIGIETGEGDFVTVYEKEDLEKFFPKRKRNTNKGSYGGAYLVCGCDKYPGAAVLSALGALSSGSGYVRVKPRGEVAPKVISNYPQAILTDDFSTSTCALFGCGVGVSMESYVQLTELSRAFSGPLIVDADGLNCLSKFGLSVLKSRRSATILTPHMREFSRLSKTEIPDILNNPISAAEYIARHNNVILLLKDSVSIVTDGERTVLCDRGNSALAKGGSGDMLAGFLCGTIARGVNPFEACVCASDVLGIAAEKASEDLTEYCVKATDGALYIPAAIKSLSER